MNVPVIRIDNLLFRWHAGEEPCLDIPDMEIHAGERIFLHGPSGSGKSTLLGLLGGVLTPERGTVRLLNSELNRIGAAARDKFRADHVGIIFQQFNLVPYLSVIDNVILPCRFSARRGKLAMAEGRSWREEAARLLAHLDLDSGLYRRLATQLSVGQQQRAAAARALIGRPEIVIADEPTSALDAERQVAFLDLLQRECAEAGATLLFVSHDRRLAPAFNREIALPALNRVGVERETT
ncbi:MAG: ATP-binding cassette domain-containing protein [Sulfuricellaceae bacterium]